MIRGIWSELNPALTETIKEALSTSNFEILRGIQCYSEITRWTYFEGTESVLNTIFIKTIEAFKEADRIETELNNAEDFFRGLGTFENNLRRIDLLREGKISFFDLKTSCQKLRSNKFLRCIEFLESNEFIETDRTDNNWDDSFVWLNRQFWRGLIEDTLVRGFEESIFTSSLGTMIAHACHGKIVKTLRPLVLALETVQGDTILYNDLKTRFIEEGIDSRKLNDFIKRDSQKSDQIKAIKNFDGNMIQFNLEMIRTNRIWLERTRDRLRDRR